jgi:serine/threonine protein kinase
VLSRLGRYRIDRLLARGGMGEVYLAAIDGAHGFRRPVVIKVIRGELVADQRIALMFVDEARLAAGLHHRNIVQIIDFDLFDGGALLVSEYVDGCDLGELLQQLDAPPRLDLAVTILSELAAGLDYAHRATGADGSPLHLVHRDVSPSNVLLGMHGEVKLADFGIAKARSRTYRTVSGSIKGKAPYMAPEQILGNPLDRRADVFSLGVLAFELTTRTHLYSGFPSDQAMRKILDGWIPDPAERRSRFPAKLARIIRRALARKADDRYASAGEVADDLDQLAASERWSTSRQAVGDLVRSLRARTAPASVEPVGAGVNA